MTKIKITPQELRRIMDDFTFDTEDTLNYTDEEIALFEKLNKLSEGDRIILFLYAEYQSLRKVASILGVSYSTTRQQINAIKKQLW